MAERKSDRWISVVQSVLLHGAVVGLLAYGWFTYKQHSPAPASQTLAIEAVVINPNAAAVNKPAARLPEAPPPPEPEPEVETGPPTPSPEELEQRKEEQRQLEDKQQAQEQRVAQEKQAAEEKRSADERQAAQERKQADTESKRVAEQKRLTEIKRKADEKKKIDEAAQRSQSESELRRSLEQEERSNSARSSPAMADWVGQIGARIQRAWLRPPSARPGIECVVYVSQVPGGEVVNVRVGECNGDQAVRESIESAVYRASPLPPPPDPALFERNLEIRFKPVD
jgi:colicin import membrane protein